MPADITTDKQAMAAKEQQANTQAECKTEKPHASRGEKLYEWLVYTGVNYWANLIVSLKLANHFTYGSGRKQLDKLIHATEKALVSTKFVTQAGAFKTSKAAWETLALTCGGWMATFATKIFEDHKRPLVHWLNKKAGVDQTAPDGHEMTPDEIYIEKEQPHQSWWNVIKRRIIASIVIVGASHAIEYTVGRKQVTDFVVDNTTAGLKSVGAKKLAESVTFKRYLEFFSLDTIFTAIHAVTMRLTNGAKQAKMPHELGDNCSPPGIEKPNEIVIQAPNVVATSEEVVPILPPANQNSPVHLKRKPITPMENYADKVSESEPSHFLAS